MTPKLPPKQPREVALVREPRQDRYLRKPQVGPVEQLAPILEATPHQVPVGWHAGRRELGAIGIGPAIANAVFHATGRRVREVPIRPEMLVGEGAG